MSTKRKLAAIVFVDIAGFTDRANRDERGALLVKDSVERQIKAAVASHHGRVVKMLGDGGMLEFASAVEAVNCALTLQDAVQDVNRELGLGDDPVRLRIGVHTGDVVEEDEDIFGNAVNIASRVQAMAKPGSIFITREVFQQIRPILNLRCSPVASKADDRMPEKVEVLQVDGEMPESVAVPARPRYRLAFGMLGILAAIAVVAFFNRPVLPTQKPGEKAQVHRVLLPDWVSPGEWFELDAGEQADNLTVYFGNRQANTKIEGTKLMVETPSDLPPVQTTISVFEANESRPMMTQATHIVRPALLASNESASSDSPEATEVQPVQQSAPEKPAGPKVEKPSAGNQASTSKVTSTPEKKPKPDPDPKDILALNQLEKEFEEGFGAPAKPATPKGTGEVRIMRSTEKLPGGGAVEPIIVAVRSAKSGDTKAAAASLEEARKQLENLDPELRKEVEAAIKTAEAINQNPGRKHIDARGMAKWSESFAFTMNQGARAYNGIAMVHRMLDAGRTHDARRALSLLEKRPDLSEGEKRAIAKLKERMANARQATETKDSPDPEPQLN